MILVHIQIVCIKFHFNCNISAFSVNRFDLWTLKHNNYMKTKIHVHIAYIHIWE